MSSQEEFIYIHEIPLLIRRPLCDYLDSLKVWEKLAINHFQFNKSDLLGPRSCEIRGESPSNYLLQMWSNRGNHQIIELFQVFKNANLPKAMEIIKDVVDKKFHRFIKLNEENATKPKSTEIKHEQWKIHRILSKEDGEPELIKDINDLVDQMSVPRIPFEDLQICTNNWQSTLGKGGFGCVYSGEWKKTKVAIKQLNFSENPKGGMKSSVRMIVNEMKFMNSCHHSNVLQVFAYSIDQIPCLVFELMTGGSLRTRLKTKDPKKILSWRKRFEIAKESCRGIQYLHTFQGPRHLIHNDIKPENILLDSFFPSDTTHQK
ncbi:IRAK1 family protein [Megaselia abdita]